MSVGEYYLEHFSEMSLEKQKHFATRIKYWFNDSRFDDFLKAHEPDHDLRKTLNNGDFSHVNNYEARKPFFEKYPDLYGLEASLFRINRLLIEYDVDLRSDFLKLYPKPRLNELCNALLADTPALITLSTYAANVLCLIDNIFTNQQDYTIQLVQKMLEVKQDRIELIYLYTHIILCMSNFYTRDISAKNLDYCRRMLDSCSDIIANNFENISLDMKLEFLVCCRLANYEATQLRADILTECQATLNSSPFVTDSRKSSRYNSLDGAEHRNILYIMAFDDYSPSVKK